MSARLRSGSSTTPRQLTADEQELVDRRRSERRVLAVVAVVAVLAMIGGGIGFQSWRTSRSPHAVETVPAASVHSGPVQLTHGKPIRLGKVDAPVTLTIYEDFHCPHCVDFEEEFGPVLTKSQQAGSVVVELYPMAFIDAGSAAAANGLACAAEAGFGHGYHRGLFANSGLSWSAGQLTELAALVTESVPQSFTACVTGSTHAGWVQSINAAADADGVTGTPTVRLDGDPVDLNELTPDSLETMIEQAAR
jgi:protein-disulfide isomerase